MLNALLVVAALVFGSAPKAGPRVQAKTGPSVTPVPQLTVSAMPVLPTLQPALKPALLTTLSAGLGNAGTEGDFMARAQLGEVHAAAQLSPVQGSLSNSVVPLAKPQLEEKAALPLEKWSSVADGLKRLSEGAAQVAVDAPTPSDLKQIADLKRFEALLTRDRATKQWTLRRGDLHNVEGDFGDYDRAYHNHVALRIGVNSIYSPYPSPEDLTTAEGKKGRFMVLSEHGAVEWNSDTAGAAKRLESTWYGRVIMRITFPSLYPWLLAKTGVAAELRPWKKVTQEWLDGQAVPHNAQTFARSLSWLPMDEWMKVGGKMGGSKVVPDWEFYVEKPTDSFFKRWNDLPGVPDGVCWRDSKLIQLFVRRHWRKLKNSVAHYRVLFAHEYTHRLQYEKIWSERYGVEMAAVAVELLRAVELVGLQGVKDGEIGFIHAGTMQGFDSGRDWARGGKTDQTAFYFKGALGGAAYELSQQTGRWEDAWEFVRRVEAYGKTEDPRAVYDEIAGRQ